MFFLSAFWVQWFFCCEFQGVLQGPHTYPSKNVCPKVSQDPDSLSSTPLICQPYCLLPPFYFFGFSSSHWKQLKLLASVCKHWKKSGLLIPAFFFFFLLFCVLDLFDLRSSHDINHFNVASALQLETNGACSLCLWRLRVYYAQQLNISLPPPNHALFFLDKLEPSLFVIWLAGLQISLWWSTQCFLIFLCRGGCRTTRAAPFSEQSQLWLHTD